MKSNGSMNRVYRVVWNAATEAWQAVVETGKAQRKGTSAKATRLTTAAGALLLAGAAWGAALPTGGSITAGSGNIAQNANVLTINQTSNKLAIDWQSFSIGQGNRVNFIQPSASAVALNRVTGSDVSVIQGALSANGQVFLINPNGVLFTPTAQVNVGGLVASTLNLQNEDFLAGNYRFAGGSSNAIINQGNIVATGDNGTGGSIALIGARITNEGSLTAPGGNVLLGAGSKVTLDLGGPVKIQVEQGMIDALIEQGGAIKADGGLVYLTAKAAGNLTSTVINHTGITEAQTLATGETGQIFLLGGLEQDRIVVGGRLDASAPNGGNGGFIETSAADVAFHQGRVITTYAPNGKTGTWLIDPNNFTIAASGGNITGAQLSSDLGTSNVAISTATMGTSGGNGDIFVNDAVNWSANKLTLSAERNIAVNSNLTATGTASLAFEYGQGSTSGAGSSYSVASGTKVLIPAATAFTWKKGSSGTTNNLVFDNGNLRFGNGTEASINSDGQLLQPWYFDNVTSGRNGWYKLTFSNYPLDIAIGSGGDGSSSWNYNGQVLTTNDSSYTNTFSPTISNRSLDISAYREGTGTIVSSVTVTFSGSGLPVKVENTYTLAPSVQFLKTDTVLTNLGGSALDNVRLWVGTRDDWVGVRDSNYKTKGNITSAGLVQISAQDQQAKAIKISESNDGVTGAAVLFYSTSSGADTVTDWCCYFSNVTNKNPRSSAIQTGQEDGSYALFLRLSNLSPSQSGGLTWYYAAAPVSIIDSVVSDVGQSAGVAPAASPIPLLSAISSAQTPLPNENSTGPSSGLVFVDAPATGAEPTGSGIPSLPAGQTNHDLFGFMKVMVVGGGIKLPDGIPPDTNTENELNRTRNSK